MAEYEAADHGERGAILRREGLYSSHITEWRKAAEAGAVSALGPKAGRDRRDREIDALRRRTCYEPLVSTHPDTQGSADTRKGRPFVAAG